MARPASTHPTELELDILKVLWRRGESTVRQVREALAPARPLAHTTVITVMNIMVDKGYLEREPRGRSHLYRPRIKEGTVRRRMLSDLVRRAFDGSPAALMLNLLEESDLDRNELAELRRRLDEKRKEDGR